MDHEYSFDLNKAALLLAALSNPTRLKLLRMISEREIDVNTIVANVDVGQSAVSQHLTKLREMKLVKRRRDRQQVFYSAEPEVSRIVNVFDDLPDRS